LHVDLSVIENLRNFGGLYGLRGAQLKAHVKELIMFIGLQDHAQKKPSQLLSGMQRCLNIGCALVQSPNWSSWTRTQ